MSVDIRTAAGGCTTGIRNSLCGCWRFQLRPPRISSSAARQAARCSFKPYRGRYETWAENGDGESMLRHRKSSEGKLILLFANARCSSAKKYLSFLRLLADTDVKMSASGRRLVTQFLVL